MSFTERGLLVLIAVLPMLIGAAILRYARRRRRVADALADARMLTRLGAGGLQRFPWLRLLLLVPAAAALGIAAAGPRWGIVTTRNENRSRSIVLAVDISKSMLARDVAPSRLEWERTLVRRLLRELAADRIGLVVFAGRAYVISPLTSDQSALRLYIDALDPEMVSQGGSSVASALAQAVDLARGPTGKARGGAVVLLTDGEATEEEDAVRQAARRAARLGVPVHTVGIGTKDGARIPRYEPGTRQVAGYIQDEEGKVHISRLGESLLRSVAEVTGGQYFRADQPGATGALLRELRTLERSEGGKRTRTELKDRTGWFVALSLVLLALDYLWARRTELRQAAPRLKEWVRVGSAAALLPFTLMS